MKKIFGFLLFGSAIFTAFGFKEKTADDVSSINTLKDAYIYGLPLVLTDLTRLGSTGKDNEFQHIRQFPDHTFKLVVRPNNDTYYSIAFLDLGQGPVVLDLPDTKDRYAVFPLMDAWTNVFASFGKRTTGTKAQRYVVAGPSWTGKTPKDLQVVKAPTDIVWIIGRIQVNSPQDGKNFVSAIQDGLKISPFAEAGKTTVSLINNSAHKVYSIEQTETIRLLKSKKLSVVDALKKISTEEYFTYLNELLLKNPGLPADKAALAKFAAIGIKPGAAFSTKLLDSKLQQEAATLLLAVLDSLGKSRTLITGRNETKPDLTIGHYGTDYQKRAAIALFGLGALGPEEAAYLSYTTDQNNQSLNGNHKYKLHFAPKETPPAQAFWSITLYDKGGYLTENSIRRYAIGDRDKLIYNADGSLDLYIQNEDPGAGKENNWLPAPKENFNLTVRVYWPTDAFLQTGNWKKPPLEKAD